MVVGSVAFGAPAQIRVIEYREIFTPSYRQVGDNDATSHDAADTSAVTTTTPTNADDSSVQGIDVCSFDPSVRLANDLIEPSTGDSSDVRTLSRERVRTLGR